MRTGGDRPVGSSLRGAGLWGPLLLGAALVVLDLVQGPGIHNVGLLAAVPLVAAALVGPLATAAHGVAAAGLGFALGGVEGWRSGAGAAEGAMATPQLVRVAMILALSLLAVGVALHRVRTERRARAVAAVADSAQLAILGPLPPVVGGLECASVYLSATSEARIGGDLVEVLDTPFGVRAVVGDVRGKGMEAVRLSGRVLGSFREAAYDLEDLTAVAAAMDRAVRRAADAEGFVTAALVQVDAATGDVVALCCGHPAPMVVDPTGAPARELDVVPSPPLGMFELDGPPEAAHAHLAPTDRLVLVTDGLLEARRPKRLSRRASGPFLPALEVLGTALAAGPMSAGLADVVARARRWARGRLDDDLAVLVLQRAGATPATPTPPGPRRAAGSTAVPRRRVRTA